MANFQQFQGDLTSAFNVQQSFGNVIKQQQLTQAEMIAQVERFNQTREQMDAARAQVGGILSAYEVDESGKPSPSAPKYVHDAFNAVKKEGGLQQMSASQLGAVMSGYQSGIQSAQQRLQGMQIERAVRAEEDQLRIDEAYRKSQEQIKAISKEEQKATTTSKVKETSYDLNKPEDIGRFMKDAASEAAKPLMLRKGQTRVEGFDIKPVLDKMAANVGDAARKAQTDAAQKEYDKAAASQRLEQLQAERARLQTVINQQEANRNQLIDINAPIETRRGGQLGTYTYGLGWSPGGETVTTSAPSLEVKKARLEAVKKADLEIAANNKAIEKINQQIAEQAKLAPTKVRISDVDAKKPESRAYSTTREYQTSYETVQRSQEALLTDEYNLITSHLKATGSVPANWNRSTFMQMKGYPNIQQVEIPGVGMYVSVNGKGEIIKTKDLAGDIGDQMKLRDATILAQQRSLNGTELAAGSGYRFTGEIRSSDIKDVNKVRMEIGTASNALANVDTLLRIAEDSSLVDKLVPGEITGVAGSISNAIQAASRTEIGGSGAWSEQDQIRIDKIVRDPTSLKNIAFRQETIASIKAYRQRLVDGLNRSGSVYGFRMSGTPNDARMAEARISRLRIAYQTALASGKNEQEALLIAQQSLGMSL